MNKDARDVLAALAAAPEGDHVLATVVGVIGSSYRRPGARMLAHARGAVVGSVSGGCLERAIIERGRWWTADGPVVRRFAQDADPDDDDRSAPGCGGTIDVLVERVSNDAPAIAALRWIAARRQPARLVTRLRDGARAATCGDATWGDPAMIGETFVEHVPAPRELLVCGRHHDVAPVVRMARLLGWDVVVAAGGASRRALGEPDDVIAPTPEAVAAWASARPGAAVVVMTHSLALDRELLAALREPSRALAYLGVLGPRHRTAKLDAPAWTRSPVGLDLGGDGPEAVALSLVAELQATWHAPAARLARVS